MNASQQAHTNQQRPTKQLRKTTARLMILVIAVLATMVGAISPASARVGPLPEITEEITQDGMTMAVTWFQDPTQEAADEFSVILNDGAGQPIFSARLFGTGDVNHQYSYNLGSLEPGTYELKLIMSYGFLDSEDIIVFEAPAVVFFEPAPPDTTKPTIILNTPGVVNRYAHDALSNFLCDDDVAIASCTSTHPNGVDVTRLGNQTITVTAVDTSGNRATKSETVRVEWSFLGEFAGIEGNQAIVARFYAATFARLPDQGGYNYWTTVLNNDTENGLESVAQFFTTSPEFENLYGDQVSDEQFVDTIYMNVLGRTPEGAGRTFWIDSLADGTQSRGSVMAFFANSPEHKVITGTK